MLFFKEPQHIETRGIPQFEGADSEPATPFRAFLLQNGDNPQVAISSNSMVLQSPNILDRLPLIGTDLPIDIVYGDKIWLEIFYNSALTPIFGIITSGRKWAAVVADTANTETFNQVYPEELEFISKYDLENKINELEATIARIDTLKQATTDQIDSQRAQGYILEAAANDAKTAAVSSYDATKQLVVEYQGQMNQFFTASPSNISKKLFRTYSLICYTTKKTSYKYDGIIISPTVSVPTTPPTVPTVTASPVFKLVQVLSSNLLLVDICFQNRFPAVLPIPYHSPVSLCYYQGEDEEAANLEED